MDQTQTPWLSRKEIDDLCDPLVQKAAQCAYLHSLGLIVKRKPNGSPLVMRSNVEAVLGAVAPDQQAQTKTKTGPNRDGLVLHFNKKG